MYKMDKLTSKKELISLVKDVSKNSDRTPYDNMNYYELSLKKMHFLYLILFKKPVFYKFECGNEKLIIPLFRSLLTNEVRLYGDGMGFGFCNFIYDGEVSLGFISDAVDEILKVYKNKSIKFNRVLENSLLYDVLKSKGLSNEIEHGVRICLHEDYNCHFNSLSKNSRQNIRTSKNRLSKQKLDYKLYVFDRKDIDSTIKSEVISIYMSRLKKYKNISFYDKLFYNYFDLGFKNISISENSKLIVLKIDGNTAAFMISIVQGESVFCPRLAINEKYNFYSPGVLLVSMYLEYIYKYMENVKFVDMMQGLEKYKFVVGGVKYNIHSFSSSCKVN